MMCINAFGWVFSVRGLFAIGSIIYMRFSLLGRHPLMSTLADTFLNVACVFSFHADSFLVESWIRLGRLVP